MIIAKRHVLQSVRPTPLATHRTCEDGGPRPAVEDSVLLFVPATQGATTCNMQRRHPQAPSVHVWWCWKGHFDMIQMMWTVIRWGRTGRADEPTSYSSFASIQQLSCLAMYGWWNLVIAFKAQEFEAKPLPSGAIKHCNIAWKSLVWFDDFPS